MTQSEEERLRAIGLKTVQSWREDWNRFAFEALGSRMDREQKKILDSVQHNPRTSVASGTARGKDYIAGVGSMCFMYLTPEWNAKGELIANTKVALTAPSARQVLNIMKPEFTRLYHAAHRKGISLPGRLVAADIRTEWEEWYLTGFKADEHQHEAWSGFHAVNTMFVVTEASGISDDTFGAIEGNLQGNSRILIVFNPNKTVGYAAKSQRGERWAKFRLNSLDAPNVVQRKIVIPGQVDHEWIEDKIEHWCVPIRIEDIDPAQDDFEYMGKWYRPEDIFRIKILGRFPKVSADTLIPQQWIEEAQKRWREYHDEFGYDNHYEDSLRLGVDVAGMGRDSTVYCPRYGNIVKPFYETNSGGRADHMQVAGNITDYLHSNYNSIACIDTIGEGAGVYSALEESGEFEGRVYSTKFSNKAEDQYGRKLKDVTNQNTFANKRAYCFWAVRDFLDPKNGFNPMMPPGDKFTEEAMEIKYFRRSNGDIMIEEKEDIKKRLGRSTDLFDSLANTFDCVNFEQYTDKSYLNQ